MSKMRVYVVFEFDDVQEGTESEDWFVDSISEACETMRVGFDAQGCWIDDVVFRQTIELTDTEESDK